MGISRDHWHKRRSTGGKRKPLRKKRKFELGRPAANTKFGLQPVKLTNCVIVTLSVYIINTFGCAENLVLVLKEKYVLQLGSHRVHTVRTRGGNRKFRATRKTRVIDVVYNASNNELVRTKTLVKNAIVVVDATPFRQWYESHYILPLGRKKGAKLTEEEEKLLSKKRSKKAERKYKTRQRLSKVEPAIEEQFQTGRLLGQCGRADGYVLEGKELEFYMRKIKAKKGK
ncbi:hypothetical protein B566_EDAN014159 [Ephemera danica]|nr:hypothetical protein B566_EDAN014159 [Ephemera danica]